MTSVVYPNSIKEILESKKNVLITDGASRGNPGPAGWAYILLSGEKRYSGEALGHSPNDTNNRMEIMGVLEGLKKVQELAIRNPLFILSDSKFLIDAISVWRFSWRKNRWNKSDGTPVLHGDLWKSLDALVDVLQPQWFHVEAHKGHPANTRCDELAVAGAQQTNVKPFEGPLDQYPYFTKISYLTLFPEVRYICWKGKHKVEFVKWSEAQDYMKLNSGFKAKKVFSAEEVEALV